MTCNHCKGSDAKLCVVPHGPKVEALLLCGQCVDALPHTSKGLAGFTIDPYPAAEIADEWRRREEPMRRLMDHHVRLMLEVSHRSLWR